MGICCGKTCPEIIQVVGKKEVATSTSSLKYESQDVQNVSSEKESDETKISPLPSIDTKIVTDQEDLFDSVAARTRYSTFKCERDNDSARRTSVYIEGRRISQDEDQIRHNLAGQRRKSEGLTTRTGKYLPKKLSLPEGQALLDYKEEFKGFNAGDFEKETPYFVKVILEKEKALSFDVNEEYEEEDGISCNVQNTGKILCDNKNADAEQGSVLSPQDEDQIRHNLAGQRRKSEGVTIRTGKYFPKKLSLPEGQALLEYKECFRDLDDDDDDDVEEVRDKDDDDDDARFANQDDSDAESFFDVKGEMLSLFNKLEADASFLHSIKDQDLKSTTSEDQSSNDDYSLVREMEAIFVELKQQNDVDKASSTHSENEQESEAVESFFEMSNEIENIVSKFDKCSVCSKSSEIRKISEEESSLMSNVGDSPDSGSFFKIQGEMESRLQNLMLHLDGSGSDEESQGIKDEISDEGLSSAEGSYFNMQEEIEFRLDLIRHGSGNVI